MLHPPLSLPASPSRFKVCCVLELWQLALISLIRPPPCRPCSGKRAPLHCWDPDLPRNPCDIYSPQLGGNLVCRDCGQRARDVSHPVSSFFFLSPSSLPDLYSPALRPTSRRMEFLVNSPRRRPAAGRPSTSIGSASGNLPPTVCASGSNWLSFRPRSRQARARRSNLPSVVFCIKMIFPLPLAAYDTYL